MHAADIVETSDKGQKRTSIKKTTYYDSYIIDVATKDNLIHNVLFVMQYCLTKLQCKTN